MLDELALAVKEVAALDGDRLTDAELTDVVVELRRVRSALDAAEARLVAEWNGRRSWAADGAKSGSAWLARTTRTPKEECASTIRLGRAVATMPQVAAAWEAGEISTAHVRRLARCHNRRTAELFGRDETVLVDSARTLSFPKFTEALDYWMLHADPDGTDEADAERRDRRRVALDRTFGGMVAGTVVLDPISGEIVSDELARLEQQLFDADWAEAKAGLKRDPLIHELARSGEQRRADALVEMAKRSARIEGGRAARPLFTVLLGADSFSHLCQLASGQVLPPSALLPWISDANLERVLFDGTPQRVISVSRKRRFTGALRRLIEVRDRGCYHEYCDEPSSRSQVDHVDPWSKGGVTAQWNGRMACPFHNRLRNRPPPRE